MPLYLCYPTNALHDKLNITHINSHTFRHQAAIFKEVLQQRCTSQPANMTFVHLYKHN